MFTNSQTVATIRRPSTRRRHLVFVRSGEDTAFLSQGVPEGRSWDLCLSPFTSEQPSGLLEAADWVVSGGLSKWHALHHFLDDNATDVASYQNFWITDDDIMLSESGAVDEVLGFFEQHGLYIAQPSLTHDSDSSFKVARQCPGFALRFTNFVECMTPIFSISALAESRSTFTKSISGLGMDILWSIAAQRRGRTLAVMDRFAVRHTRPVGGGGFYGYLQSIGVDHHAELLAGFREAAISEFCPHTIGGVLDAEVIYLGDGPATTQLPLLGTNLQPGICVRG